MTICNVTENIQNYYDSADFSDVTIEINGKSIKAHRLILAQGSDWFKSILNVKNEPGVTSTIYLTEHDGPAFERLLRHMYGFRPDYVNDDPLASFTKEATVWPGTITKFVNLFLLGKKYGVESFAKTASQRFYATLNTATTAENKMAILTRAVQEVYVTHADTAQDLRERVVTHFTARATDVNSNGKYKELFSAAPEFSLDVVDAFTKMRTNNVDAFGNAPGSQQAKKRKITAQPQALPQMLPQMLPPRPYF